MYPDSPAAHTLVVIEAVLGLLVTALCTGLVFAKFSQPTGRINFSNEVTVSPLDGVPTLIFRVGNERGNQVVEATIRVTMIRTVRTKEGVPFYRMTDLPLVRERSAAMTRSWNVMHVIDPSSPLHGYTPERMAAEELELIASLLGIDDTSAQPVHGRHQYEHDAIVWGARHADVLSESADGNMLLDLGNFHQLVATTPTADFPYPKSASKSP
jgi:inward rectifier potassium channel